MILETTNSIYTQTSAPDYLFGTRMGVLRVAFPLCDLHNPSTHFCGATGPCFGGSTTHWVKNVHASLWSTARTRRRRWRPQQKRAQGSLSILNRPCQAKLSRRHRWLFLTPAHAAPHDGREIQLNVSRPALPTPSRHQTKLRCFLDTAER